jgi:hypothetical protein
VESAFKEGDDPVLQQLDDLDIRNIWTYEGDNYHVGDRGALIPRPKVPKPGLGSFLLLISSAFLVITAFLLD